ncbi:39S ribosomal protein L34, mitochondrial [Sceloporus undulatus]|uniref:39S ribosomal protein L34, mitochondrial n=1 Tax=Sceloporus undulatus TaxID=8520 RepID=UPI001C4B4B93|nr:39S ribosomal protein L34, mitochondrial [Sceloporus undulatus]
MQTRAYPCPYSISSFPSFLCSVFRSLLLIRQAAASSVISQRGIWTLFSSAWKPSLYFQEPLNALRSLPGSPALWGQQQIRTKTRGNEYQPSNIKRKHKHGWIKRIRTASGIEVILRRMLKGRKSLSH